MERVGGNGWTDGISGSDESLWSFQLGGESSLLSAEIRCSLLDKKISKALNKHPDKNRASCT